MHGNVLYPNDNCTVAEYHKVGDEWKLQNNRKGQTS